MCVCLLNLEEGCLAYAWSLSSNSRARIANSLLLVLLLVLHEQNSHPLNCVFNLVIKRPAAYLLFLKLTELTTKWSTLKHKRRTVRLTILYKITTGKACVRCPDQKFQPASGRRSRHSLRYECFRCRVDYRSSTFFSRNQELETTSPAGCSRRLRCHPLPQN